MNRPKVFNRAVGIPAPLLASLNGVRVLLKYGHHARQAAANNHNGLIRSLPDSMSFSSVNVVEVEAYDGMRYASKVVVRIPNPGDDYNDLVLVVIPEFGINRGFVKTVWLNRRDDNHATLRAERLA